MFSAKFAVRALTQAPAKKFKKDSVTVDAHYPSVVDTEMWAETDRRMGGGAAGAEIGKRYYNFVVGIALGRVQTPEDVAAFVS